ncbi:MAG: NAD(P)H-dependent oxidoreductase subunit E [Ferrovibrio sp.]|uniref:NADH-ubiquinone oxidoreductase-F iron-sulfur binding region domain-containing protein n=1 Tax=Ferrovibrio sp. TaxID=1917215 RepID=UPI0026096611|nr:NADH-ubiquinone oxidoreductase-F iron-sulfur binding region domain-containing protein [Ferrovibrio sp.]MCW0233619.1 NAD(P)H-dependent oxidoreductase subunit E [Ferrovibrio sp.]
MNIAAPTPRQHRGGRSGRALPRGRQASDADHAALRAITAPDPARRDLLIEYLHAVNDAKGHLPAALLVALAEAMRLPLAEVFETATFYAHFRIVEGDEPAMVTLRICDSLSCCMAGADALAAQLEALGPDMRIERAPCMGQCDRAPCVTYGRNVLAPATLEHVQVAHAERAVQPVLPPYKGLAAYRTQGGYAVLSRLRSGALTREALLTELETANLRGMGGAGFPTARKWRALLAQPGPRLLAVNGDEGEPGTLKDRWFLEADPHGFLEGLLIAAHVIEADAAYIYLRDEYPALHVVVADELQALREAGLLGDLRIELRRGAGAYICGEESAMLESIEGKRGLPRQKPPYPFQVGLFGRPTLINNVETLYWVAAIADKGAAWWNSHGRNGSSGLRSYSVSGRVRNPGVKLAPAGLTITELIEDYSGGMLPGHQFMAYLPGGASGGILPASMNDIPLDFGTLEKYGCFIGSAAVIVLSDQDDVKDAALNLMKFFRHESCGQCTPCRVGTEKAATLMAQPKWDEPLLRDLAQVMRDASICGLGQAAPNPLLSVLERFR